MTASLPQVRERSILRGASAGTHSQVRMESAPSTVFGVAMFILPVGT
jgi:hypothetical protein